MVTAPEGQVRALAGRGADQGAGVPGIDRPHRSTWSAKDSPTGRPRTPARDDRPPGEFPYSPHFPYQRKSASL